ncbi:hypothetical protein BJX70DRAFT_218170 [Aspergillus crustosus]
MGYDGTTDQQKQSTFHRLLTSAWRRSLAWLRSGRMRLNNASIQLIPSTNMSHRRSRLAKLPTELCDMIRLEIEETEDLINFSLVCKRFRELSIPSIFYSVGFPCSKRGLEGLQEFAKSRCCLYTVHLIFWMPLFCKPEVLDVEHFLSVMKTPESVADIECGDGQDYISSRFDSLHQIYRRHYEDTQEIMNSDMEFTALLAALQGSPRLTDLIFDFSKKLHTGWDGLYKWKDLVLHSETFVYHIPILSRALSHAKAVGQHFESLRLVGFSPPLYGNSPIAGEAKDTIRQSLKNMFGDIDCIRLSRSPAAIRLCREDPWTIQNLEILNLEVPRYVLKKFLKNNVALRTIGVYNVRLNLPDAPGSMTMLTPSTFLELVNKVSSEESGVALWKLKPHDGLVWEVERD